MLSDQISFMDLVELTKRIQAKELSSVEVTRHQIDRIDSLDGSLKSFILKTPELALQQARQVDDEIMRGEKKGPLHGAPLGIKDLCWVKGVTATGGMPLHAEFVPREDGTVVRKLRNAGAIFLGMLRMTEGAFADHHPDVPSPVNPWGSSHWTGVSSSGSGVATAAGLCFGSIGSDTGGSIRFPSVANGLTGLKPTWGLVSRYGAYELAATLDHLGPITRTAADAAAMLGAMAGADVKDPTASLREVPDYLATIGDGIRGLRIGIDASWNARGTDEDTLAMLSGMIGLVTELGGVVKAIRFPDETAMIKNWLPLCGVEAAVAHQSTYPAQKLRYGAPMAGLLDLGLRLSAVDYQRMILDRISFRGQLDAVFQDIDLILAPAQPIGSPTNDRMKDLGTDPDFNADMLRFTAPFDMSGHPTITLPGGLTTEGMPIGFQFVSDHFNESLLFRAAHAVQQASDWHRRRPAEYLAASIP